MAKGLSIMIVGCGKVGETLIEQLIKEGHDITIVDKNAEKIQTLSGIYDIMGVVGNGASYSIQVEAGIENTDLMIAVTESDELNLLCCTVAKRVAGCATIARVRNPDYNQDVTYLQEKLGLAMIINPELETAKEAAHVLALPTALDVNSFAHGQAETVSFRIPEGNILDGIRLYDMSKHFPAEVERNCLICAIERGEEVYIPNGNFQLQKGDVITIVSTRKIVRKFLRKLGFQTNQVRSTMIIGGGKASFYLAQELLQMGVAVKIIEKDRARCEELSLLLPDAVILNGDGTDAETLKECGIQYAESFVPLTGIDEENIMLSLHVRSTTNAKVITKINRLTFRDVISTLDLGAVIYPRYLTSEAIVAYVRAKSNSMHSNVQTLCYLGNPRIEAIEFQVGDHAAVTGIELRRMKLKANVLIAFINRNGKFVIPSGADTIEAGDTVMIVTTNTGFTDIQDILA